MTKFFLFVYDYFLRHKRLLFTILFVLVVAFVISAFHIRFKEDISRFLPDNKEYSRINNAYKYIASSNKITIYCSSTDTSDRQKQVDAVDALVERLNKQLDTTQIKDMLYKIDPAEMLSMASFVVENMPYFLDDDDYQRMDSLLTRDAISKQLEADRNLLISSAGIVLRQNIISDPLRFSNGLMRKLQNFQVGDQFVLYQDHIFSEDGKALIVIDCTIPASETSANDAFVGKLKSCIADTEKEFKDISFQSFGAAEIALTNAKQIKQDTVFTSLFAIIIVFALLIYSFRSVKKISLIFISVAFGGLFALAAMNVISGEVSIIAIGISSIMFGIAINYPLHFIDHYNHTSSSRLVIKDIIEPLTIGNITTVGAFMSLIFIGSDAMSDLGWFASLLLVGTIVFVLLFLPHLLPNNDLKRRVEHPLFGNFVGQSFEKNRWLILIVVALTVFFSFFSGDSRFETNMQKINYMTKTQQVEYEYMMGILNKHQHVLYYVTEGDNLEKALESNEKNADFLHELLVKKDVSKVGGIGDFFPSQAQQAKKLARWNSFWNKHRNSVLTYLDEEAKKLGFSSGAFDDFKNMVCDQWSVVEMSHFDQIKDALVKNYIFENEGKTMIVNLLYTDADKSQSLENLLNERNDSSVAFDAGSITRRMVASLSDNFNYVLYVCGFIVFAFLIFSMGRIELSIIAFIPLALSWIWILGLMNIFDIKFNIVNIILATFIFGQGDDYTIFMTEGLMYEYTYRRKMLASYKNSIALSAVIMFVGMGMLVFAKHPALRSLGEVTVVGMLSVVVMAYIFPSFLFHFLTIHKNKKRQMPVTLKRLLIMSFSFFLFLIMSVITTFGGWILFSFGRTTEKKKLIYHRFLYKIANFVIYHIPQVKTTFNNISGETFEKPSVIICNHQSHIDLMCIMMLTPKLVVLTNDWVWNSPFYGRIIKYADFYPVSNGIDNMTEKLNDLIKRGYSIVVFPEGTRSADCSILRFHRGAFYLAEKLNLDIVPVMIHGVGHVLPKNEFMFRKGEIHIQVMSRITLDDERFSKDYSVRSREIRKYYKREYELLCQKCETPDYYADLVIHNYIYKGPLIEREVRRNMRRHKSFVEEIAAMPDEGEMTLVNTGYGEYPLLLALVKKRLQITVIESDNDKRELAENCASVPSNLHYIASE